MQVSVLNTLKLLKCLEEKKGTCINMSKENMNLVAEETVDVTQQVKTAIKLENLTKVFVNKRKNEITEVVAVKGMDVEIEPGTLIGLLGPSGCGKSTTLYMIAGLHEPTEGRIHFVTDIDGEVVAEDVTELSPEKRGIGLVFQNYALYPHMTVAENITFPLGNLKGEQKVEKEVQLERAQAMADLVGIGELMERKPAELSGGQQQRVAIARALVKMPRVLLLDEPLSNLDARLRLQTREEIRRIQQETGITTVFVTHDQEEAMSISDLIVVMDKGVVQQIGKPQDVYENPVNEFVAKFLGTPPINMYNGVVKKGALYIGDQKVLNSKDVAKVADGEYSVGVRPDGYVVDLQAGNFELEYSFIENIGRDKILVMNNEASQLATFRIIIPSDVDTGESSKVKFNLNPKKTFIFKKDTGERVL